MAIKRWMYRGGHPNRLTKIINRGWAWIHSLGIFPNYMVTLEVIGRQSGNTTIILNCPQTWTAFAKHRISYNIHLSGASQLN